MAEQDTQRARPPAGERATFEDVVPAALLDRWLDTLTELGKQTRMPRSEAMVAAGHSLDVEGVQPGSSYKLVRPLLEADRHEAGAVKGWTLRRLARRQFYYRRVMGDTDAEFGFAALNSVFGSGLHDAYLTPPNESVWRVALGLAGDTTPGPFRRRMLDENPRDANIARAVKRLRRAGFVLTVEGGEVVCGEETHQAIAGRLDHLRRGIGGEQILTALMDVLRRRVSADRSRFRNHRVTSQTLASRASLIPVGLLLRLAYGTRWRSTLSRTKRMKALERLLSVSRDWATLEDVDVYWSMHGLFGTARQTLLETLPGTAAFDTLYGVPQLSPHQATQIHDTLLSRLEVDEEYREAWGTRLRVSKALYAEMTERGHIGPILIPPNHPGHDLWSDQALKMRGPFSKLPPSPMEAAAQTSMYAPPAALPTGELMLPDLRIAGPAILVSHMDYACVRGVDGGQRGTRFEHAVRESLAELGADVFHGAFTARSTQGDVDALVESPDWIWLFEMKSKVLTTTARSGDALSILRDVGLSVVRGHAQLATQHRVLIEEGELTLTRGGETHRVELKGREVGRVVISMTEFGGLQDTSTLRQYLSHWARVRFSQAPDIPPAPGAVDSHREMNETGAKLGRELSRLAEITGQAESVWRLSSSFFLSHALLIALVQKAADFASFERLMLRLESVSDGTLCALTLLESLDRPGSRLVR